MTTKLLIVDDELENLNAICALLDDETFSVLRTTRAETAYTIAVETQPDLIITDWDMPGMNGIELIRKLQSTERTAEIPVIMCTGRMTSAEDLDTALAAGAVDYVRKPVEPIELKARVRSILLLADSHREVRAQRDALADRNARLEEAYSRIARLKDELERAQEQIVRLEAPDDAWLEQPERWAAAMAEEIARGLGATRVDVFTLEGTRLVPFAADGPPPPMLEALVTQADGVAGPDLVDLRARPSSPPAWGVPIRSVAGQTRGALVVEGKETLTDPERNVLRSFARHLATALDLHRFRAELDAAEARRGTTRRELVRQGIAVVDLCPRCGLCVPDDSAGERRACPDDGEPLETGYLLPHLVGGRYRLARRLGEGGMGTVFRAEDQRLGRDVALKILNSGTLGDPVARFRFEREAQAMARVRHPNVVALFDSGEIDDGRAFLVLELLDGRPLDQVLAGEGRGRPEQVAALLRQLGSALGAVHRAGVLHRDVKPANVLLLSARALEAKLLDFGIARGLHGKDQLTRTGFISGTPAYMSPEQVYGERLDERSDLYSLAALAYEALTGRPVVGVELEPGDILRDVVDRKPPKPSAVVPGLPDEVDTRFQIALAKDRELRPHDVATWAEGCAAALERVRLAKPPAGWLVPGALRPVS